MAVSKARPIEWVTTPDHGGLRILRAAYPDAVGFATGFSAYSKTTVLLEEDCDASAFLKAHPEIEFKTLPDVGYDYVNRSDGPSRTWAQLRDAANMTPGTRKSA
jgi:hypothetical protein